MAAVNFETVTETLQILEGFSGISSLKQLQAHLNLDSENAPISRSNWKSGHADCLMADPVITATIGGSRGLFEREQGFKVIYSRLKSPELRLTHERDVVGELMKRYPYALHVFSDAPQKRFHFLNVKDEPSGQKRRLFRRITVGNGERARTAAEQLSQIDGESLREAPLSAVQQRFDQAFDVGPVTKRFYQEYRRVFEEVRDAVKGFPGDKGKEARNLFTQRLFNRLMFLRFIQKKGWMTMDGSTDYLAALWESHQKLHQAGKNFYEDRLRLLFAALNNERTSIVLQGKGGAIERTIGRVKYLNGGLFEETPEDRRSGVTVPDNPFGLIFDRENGLFEVFNFTITESTPLDVEVAVDPEMLGKIFEELVTGRHESGSYYTPKPIVSFMCREALKGYLETAAPAEKKELLGRFVDEHEPAGIRDAEAVLNALRRVTVCDPACGSGAYLLGMMHELLDLRECLFRQRRVDTLTVYQRKLEIIQNNIYGVDIDSFAVGIARLRLWLSLAVDYEGPEPQPLPNLDYKIETGDSVCSPSPGALQMGLQQPLVDQFLVLKRQYMTSHHGGKETLRTQIAAIREEIVGFTRRHADGFDWVIDFAEVFCDGGFDVTVANPPYINAIEFKKKYSKDYRNSITESFESTKGAYDFYVPFFERAVQILKPSGHLVFITPNKYLSAKYAVALRAYMLDSCTLHSIADISAAEVFASASVYPVLTHLSKGAQPPDVPVRSYRLKDPKVPDLSSMISAEFSSALLRLLPENIWGFLLSDDVPLLSRLLASSSSLETLGKVNASSTAAEADEYTSALLEKRGRNGIKILNTGTIDPLQSLWGVYPMTHSGLRILTPYLDLMSDVVSQRRREMYRSPKLVFAKMGKACEAVYDIRGEYASVNTNCFFEPVNQTDLPFLAGYCNSKLFMFLYDQFFRALRMSGGYYQFQAPQLRVMPVPRIGERDKAKVGELAVRISECEDESTRKRLFKQLDKLLVDICELSTEEAVRVLES